MFDALTERLSNVFRGPSGRGRTTEEKIREGYHGITPVDVASATVPRPP